MRKIYSLVLMATMLLVGTNLWAQANGKIKIVRTGVEYEHLQDAFTAASDGDVLELTDNMTEAETKAAWFGEPTSGSIEPESENYYADHDRSITLDLKGHTYYNSTARFIIALTRGQLRIKSTGGEGEIKLKKHGIAVYGTYLKINAKTQTPFSHLIIEENVKITEGDKAIVLTVMDPEEVAGQWKWERSAEAYPLDYCCEIFPKADYGVANGARIDIYGKVDVKEYALQVNGTVRSALEYLNEDGSYNTSMGVFPFYYRRSETELFLPGKTMANKTEVPHEGVYTQRILKYNHFVGGNGDDTQDPGEAYNYAFRDNGSNDYVLTSDDNDYAPYIHIHPSAELKVNEPTATNVAGFYSAGYSRVYIEGTVVGSTGVYVKSGDVELHDASITSNYSGNYAAANAQNSGINAGGSGIVIESNATYTGNIEASVTGDTYVEGSTGYAIDEAVTNAPTTDVDIIDIQGGTFVGGNQGTISISEVTADANLTDPEDVQIIIAGGNITNGNATIGTDDLEDFLNSQANDTHITIVDGTMVVSQGAAPATNPEAAYTDWAYIKAYSDTATNVPSMAWTKIEDAEIASGTVRLGELQIISGSENNLQQLTIRDGATLQVNHLIMNDYARIIVEAGGKLIVRGKQGIVAPQVENIKLEASAEAQATFLFNPAVTSNRHPNAQVEVYTNCYQMESSPKKIYVYQRLALPVMEGMKPTNDFNGSLFEGNNSFTTYAWYWNGNIWASLSHWTDLKPFIGYEFANNATAGGVTYTFSGQLVGNGDAEYDFPTGGYDYFGCSHMAPIYADSLLKPFENSNMEATAWVWNFDSHNWTVINSENIKDRWAPAEIQPMTAFVLRLKGSSGKAGMNYASAIWGNPNFDAILGRPSQVTPAPARNLVDDVTNRAMINVRAENGFGDAVKLIEKDYYTTEFDNGADASKFMCEDGINLYASTEAGDLACVATDNLMGTLLSFRSGSSTQYTINLSNVIGEEYALRDNVTGQVITFAEGATYTFTQEAYTTVPARFELVEAAKMPTAIENIEEVAKASGVYTMTGQYVGRDFTKLPAGVYVVNGVKIVK